MTATSTTMVHARQIKPRSAQVHRHFSSSKSCLNSVTPTPIAESSWLYYPSKEICAPQNFLAIEGVHRGKRSLTITRIQPKNSPVTTSRTASESIHPQKHGHSDFSSIRGKQQRTIYGSPSQWTCRCTAANRFHHQPRQYLHSTRSRRSFSPRAGSLGSGLSFDEKRSIVAELRHKALVRAFVPALWAAYNRIVKAGALELLHSDDVIVLFQALQQSPHSEEAMEIMIRVAMDINSIGKQLPQTAFEILATQTIDQMPAEQVKALLWQIQGRRRFFTDIIQSCESNTEMKRFFELYIRLLNASLDVERFSTYFQSRQERTKALSNMILQWIDDGNPRNTKVVEKLLIFLLDRNVFGDVYKTFSKLSKESVQFSLAFYTTAIHRFGRQQEFDLMDMTLERMVRQGLEPSIEVYSAIIDAHSKGGNLREAQRRYQDVLAAGLTPTDTIFGPMVEAVGKMGDYDMTKQLVDQMNASGVPSNQFTLSALLQTVPNDPSKSVELFKELSKQIQPNAINYNILIRIFQANTDLDGAFRVFRAMILDRVKPDQYTFSTILSLFAARGDTQGAEDFWSEMVSIHKVTPNCYSYASMMQAYCVAEDMLSAQTVYREMIQAGILPNEVIFGTLLSAYARRGDLTQMLSIYDAMRAEGLKPNSYIYSNLLYGLVKDGDMGAAMRLYQNMEEDGLGRNVMALTIIMKGYADNGNIKEAREIYTRMIDSGLSPNFMTYATLMNAYIKRGERTQARLFLNKIIRAPDFVNINDEDLDVVNTNKNDQLAEAEAAQRERVGTRGSDRSDDLWEKEEMQGMGPIVDVGHLSRIGTEGKPLKPPAQPRPLIAFTPLMDAYAKEGDFKATKRIFELIQSRHMRPNTVTLTILMDGFRRAGKVEGVLEVWQQLFSQYESQWKRSQDLEESERPSKKHAVELEQDRHSTKTFKLQRMMQQPVSIVLDSLCYSGRLQEAQAIWTRLETLNFPFDSCNWNDYCVALARNGRLLEACQIVHEKLLTGFMIYKDSLKTTQQPRSPSSATAPSSTAVTSSKRSSLHQSPPIEGALDSATPLHDTQLDSALSGTLFYARPRTFAALADCLEGLLIDKNEKTRTRFVDYLHDPIVKPWWEVGPNEDPKSKQLEVLHTIEDQLKPYPSPFEQLDEKSRQYLWGLVRTNFPDVLDVLGEGILVASSQMKITQSASMSSSHGSTSRTDAGSAEGSSAGLEEGKGTSVLESSMRQRKTEEKPMSGILSGFRQWRPLQSVIKDNERKQLLDDHRKPFADMPGRRPERRPRRKQA
ncbi:hypothetical protein BGZ94_005952 [Podila epigama]|nr:hypothetical protein BGZ94_005952 [Podila epigama]